MRHQIAEKQKISKPSSLLTQDENEQVFSLLGRKCQSLSTAVIQLFKTESSAHSNWRKKHTAVLCFIKDSSKRSYFMRAYCLIRNELVWEHELYENIRIFKTRPYLITFEGQDGHVAFNFASENECESYHRIAENTIETRNRKRQERRNRPKSQLAPNIPLQIKSNEVDGNNIGKVQLRNNPNLSSVQLTPAAAAPKLSFGNLKEKKKGNRKVTKNDIGTPTNFVHISHVGWDAQKGFDLTGSEDDEMLKPFFNKAGVSEQQLKDRDTRAFIYDFVQHHNVIATVKTERIEKPKAPPPPPVPKRDHNQNGSNQRTAPPPPPPTRQPPPPVPTTTPISRAPPPTRPPPININIGPPSVVSSVIPPPPPQPPTAPPPPPMPTSEKIAVPSLPVINDTRNALMESIRKGANLKKVDQATLSTGSGGGDARNELLSEIRHGTTLRPVTNRELPSGSFNRDSGSGGTDALADALRRALQDRGRAIHSSEDESSSSSDNDGEWED